MNLDVLRLRTVDFIPPPVWGSPLSCAMCDEQFCNSCNLHQCATSHCHCEKEFLFLKCPNLFRSSTDFNWQKLPSTLRQPVCTTTVHSSVVGMCVWVKLRVAMTMKFTRSFSNIVGLLAIVDYLLSDHPKQSTKTAPSTSKHQWLPKPTHSPLATINVKDRQEKVTISTLAHLNVASPALLLLPYIQWCHIVRLSRTLYTHLFQTRYVSHQPLALVLLLVLDACPSSRWEDFFIFPWGHFRKFRKL